MIATNRMPQEAVAHDTRTSANDSSVDGAKQNTPDQEICMCISNSAKDRAH